MGGRVKYAPEVPGAVYIGEVVHKRLRPRRHDLRYRVFSLLADLDRLEELDARLRLFSVDRFNVFSLHRRDFGPHDGTSISAFIRARARAAGLDATSLVIEMLAYPRFLGYAFNPLTVYYLRDAEGQTRMLIYEVRNTFGEHHFYEALVQEPRADAPIEHGADKRFYVSPFNSLDGSYRFAIRPPGAEVFNGITLTTAQGPLLTAWFKGTRQPLSDRILVKLALAYPFMTAKVIGGIHWEALKLLLKGVPLTLRLRREMRQRQRAARQDQG